MLDARGLGTKDVKTKTITISIDYAPEGAEYGMFWNDPTVSRTVKHGKTKNIPSRDDSYATSECQRGYFVIVIQVLDNQIYNDSIVEKILSGSSTLSNSNLIIYIKFISLLSAFIPELISKLISKCRIFRKGRLSGLYIRERDLIRGRAI